MRMGKRRVTLITAVWKRHYLTGLVLNRFRNIKAELADMIDLELIAVGSEGDKSQELCENYGFAYVEYDNMPLNRSNMPPAARPKKLIRNQLTVLILMIGSHPL